MTPAPLTLEALLTDARTQAPHLFPAASFDAGDPVITAVVQDHRRVTAGALFVAREGARFDGHEMLASAEKSGAAALVGERPLASLPFLPGVPYLQIRDTRSALPFLAAAVNRHPSESVRVIGVTGTDGKTTTSYLLHWLLSERYTTGLLSTAGARVGDVELTLEGHFTTPEAPEVQGTLARFSAASASHAVLESSSHGFAAHRLDAVRYRLGVVTNLSPEHIDFHGSLEAYREAKATLVRRAERSVLNRDDSSFHHFHSAALEGAGHSVLSYGEHASSDLRISRVASAGAGLEFALSLHGERLDVKLPLLGRYNAWNAAAAVAAASLEGVPFEAAASRLATFPGVPGRMQLVATDPFTVIVDFAHTAPALTSALTALAGAARRLIVVVGAAGERDPRKRGPLGAAAVNGADLAIFTEEDSRSEDVHAILAAVSAGAAATGAKEGQRFMIEPDRAGAIRLALTLARPGDLVLLAGKGHERTLERSDRTLPWDEAAEALRALAELGA